jgi:uncharacterized protein
VKTKSLFLSPDLSLPLDAVTQTFAILAMRGAGKTHTASVLAEELAWAGLPFVVLDPTGAWWGLRAAAYGREVGYPVTIVGGDHADAPLEETAGKVLADMLVEDPRPLLLDMSRLSKGAMRRFTADFLERLYQQNRRPLHVIIDEADAFAPQKPRADELRMLGAVDEVVRRGRIRGLGCTLVTQRSAVLNKDVLTQSEVLFALRTAHPRDRAPVLEWMKVHATESQLAKVTESLATLPLGDAWVMSAGWLGLFRRVHIRARRTFDSSATPKPGVQRAAPKAFALIDPKLLQERLASAIEHQKATDPVLLQRQVADLKAAVKKLMDAKPTLIKTERVEVPVLKETQLKRLETVAQRVSYAADTLAMTVRELRVPLATAAPREPVNRQAVVIAERNVSCRSPAGNGGAAGAPTLRSGERRMLATLARSHPVKYTRAQLGTLSGFAPRGGTFGTYFGVLKRHDLIEEVGVDVGITPAGLALLGSAPPAGPQTTDEVLALWRSALRSGERRMLDELLACGGTALTRHELGEKTGFTSTGGTFGTYLGVLRRNGLVETRDDLVWPSSALMKGKT